MSVRRRPSSRLYRPSAPAPFRPPVAEPLERRTMLSSAFRPPSVPLVAYDPGLSVWSDANNLTDDVTRSWTGTAQPLVSLVRVDGTSYRLMGTDPSSLAAFPQTNLQVTPTRSIYDFDNGHVHVTLTFTTPRLPGNLDVFSWPITYVNWAVSSSDGKTHAVQLYYSTGSELAVNTPDQVVQWGRQTAGPLQLLDVGTVAQTLLEPTGDGVRIDYGYAYTAARTGQSSQAIGGDETLIGDFTSTGTIPAVDDTGTRAPNNNEPVLGFAFPVGTVGTAVVQRHVIVGYDEEYEVNYLGANLLPYWKRTGATMSTLMQSAEASFTSLSAQCVTFDNQLTTDLTTAGGPQYAQLTALAYRQSLAAEGIAADANGQPLLFTKEDTSNGDIATADVIYPGDPLLLLLSPKLAAASVQPLLAYAASPAWTQPYAPHDLGTYPVASGDPSGNDGDEQQPVEESGNLLILVDAIAHAQGNASYASQYWPTLTKWAQYLEPYAYDPQNQLTTDDFLGTIDHSTNLAVKAIEALGAYAQLAQQLGDTAIAASYRAVAAGDVTHLLSVANDGNHLQLGYGDANSWSELYNLVWDKILGINLFPTSLAAEEVAYYKTVLGPYGLPVESTTTSGKADWSTWTAALSTNLSDFETLVTPVYNLINTTTYRYPFQDLYNVDNNTSGGFDARSVVGGLFIQMLENPTTWAKYDAQAANPLGLFAPLPVVTTILPTAQTSPQTWRYSTAQPPPANWTSPTFDDSAWATGLGGFGTAGTPGAIVNTTWNTDNIYLRKTITLPMSAAALSSPAILAYHDEDMSVYFNGVLAVTAPGYITGYSTFAISSAAAALLTPGATITIAVSCLQTTGGQDVDVGLVNVGTPAAAAGPVVVTNGTIATPSSSVGVNLTTYNSTSVTTGPVVVAPTVVTTAAVPPSSKGVAAVPVVAATVPASVMPASTGAVFTTAPATAFADAVTASVAGTPAVSAVTPAARTLPVR